MTKPEFKFDESSQCEVADLEKRGHHFQTIPITDGAISVPMNTEKIRELALLETIRAKNDAMTTLEAELARLRSQVVVWRDGGARGGVVVPAHIEWCLIVVAGDIIGAVWFDAEAPAPGFREESNDSALWLFDSVDHFIPLSSIPVPEQHDESR